MIAELVLDCVVCRAPEDRCSCSGEQWRSGVAEILDRTSLRLSEGRAANEREVRS